jgi:predicted GIY-YIG superfamily endonuclease
MPFVYILRCADDTFYVGRTNDLAAREKTHNDGLGVK